MQNFLSAVKWLPATDLLSSKHRSTIYRVLLELEDYINSDMQSCRSCYQEFTNLLKVALAEELNDKDIWWYLDEAARAASAARRDQTIPNPQYSSDLNGRQHILQGLPAVEEKYDRDTWTRITRDLFLGLDRPYFDMRARLTKFCEENKNKLPLSCAKWALPLCGVLQQLASEARLVAELIEFRNWDDGILKDALEALRYSIFDYFGPIAMLLQDYCNEKYDEPFTGTTTIGNPSIHLGTFGEVGTFCKNCLINAEIALMDFMLHVALGQHKRDGWPSDAQGTLEYPVAFNVFYQVLETPVADRVPTMTFLELVIQNQCAIQRRSVVTVLDQTNLDSATEEICKSPVRSFYCLHANPLPQVKLLSLRKNKLAEYPVTNGAGIPRTMVIVVDRKTGIITTGATPPAYDPNFPFLDKMAKEINRHRLQETFCRAVHLCSNNVTKLLARGANKAGKGKIENCSDDVVDKVYEEYMAATKQADELLKEERPTVDPLGRSRNIDYYSRFISSNRFNEGYEAIPGPQNTIFCWAFDTATFELNRPCLRCQRMYSKWVLNQNPHNVKSKRTSLDDLYARDALRYNVQRDTCSYCAETTAAAKMYLLRSGQLTLA